MLNERRETGKFHRTRQVGERLQIVVNIIEWERGWVREVIGIASERGVGWKEVVGIASERGVE